MNSSTAVTAAANPIETMDPELWQMIDAEDRRQASTLEMIASENHVSPAVMAAVGSCLTNKYCEGYPGRRYYSGCTHYDDVESLAIERAKQLFGCKHANVQPHSGANANLAAFVALLEPGDTYTSVVLNDGGHLTHGSPVNISGKWFRPIHYPLVYDKSRDDYGHIDYAAAADLCHEHKPKLIMCGYSAYPREIQFERFAEIAAQCGALLLADIAHIAGLIAVGVHPSPFPHCDVVPTTTHKTLRGPRGGMVLCREVHKKNLDRAVFPGVQGGPLMHIIAAKAVCLKEAAEKGFVAYQRQVIANAQRLAAVLATQGFRIVSGGTDNHLVLVDVFSHGLTGKVSEAALGHAGITVNKNAIPFDEQPPMVASGIRLGTPALTTRGMTETEMELIGELIERVLAAPEDDGVGGMVRSEVESLCRKFPLYQSPLA